MKKTLVFAMAMAMGVSAVAFAANPFSDVPQGHWAYDAVAKLAAQGVVEGYGDGTFEGGKAITRYEMAQIVAKAMAKGAVKSDDKLVAEFQQELQSLGVRVSKLEKKVDNVKISGQVRVSYADLSVSRSASDKDLASSAGAFRSRLFFNGEINKNWTYQGMLQNNRAFGGGEAKTANETVTFQRAFVTGKYGNFTIMGGRYNTVLHEGNFYDDRTEALRLEYGKDFKVALEVGRLWDYSSGRWLYSNVAYDGQAAAGKYWDLALRYDKKNWGVAAEYTDVKDMYWTDSDINNKVFSLGAYYRFNGGLKIDAMYLRGSLGNWEKFDDALQEGKSGFVFGLSYKGAKANKVGSWGVYGKYYNQGNATVLAHTMNGFHETTTGFSGYMLGVNWTVAKNMVAAFEYYDLKMKDGVKYVDGSKYRTMWTELVFTF